MLFQQAALVAESTVLVKTGRRAGHSSITWSTANKPFGYWLFISVISPVTVAKHALVPAPQISLLYCVILKWTLYQVGGWKCNFMFWEISIDTTLLLRVIFFTIAQLCQINFSYISRPNGYFNGQYDISYDHRLLFVCYVKTLPHTQYCMPYKSKWKTNVLWQMLLRNMNLICSHVQQTVQSPETKDFFLH